MSYPKIALVALVCLFPVLAVCGCSNSVEDSGENQEPPTPAPVQEATKPGENGPTFKIDVAKEQAEIVIARAEETAVPAGLETNPPVPLSKPLPTLLEAAEGCNSFTRPVAEFVVGEDGTVIGVSLERDTGCERGNEVLMEYLKAWTFEPALRGGMQVEGRLVVGINLGS